MNTQVQAFGGVPGDVQAAIGHPVEQRPPALALDPLHFCAGLPPHHPARTGTPAAGRTGADGFSGSLDVPAVGVGVDGPALTAPASAETAAVLIRNEPEKFRNFTASEGG
nr:hypothetical protein [Micromonospora provocatoris]